MINLNIDAPNLSEVMAALAKLLIRSAGANTDTEILDRLIRIEERLQTMDQKLQDQITALQATVKADTDVESSAVALLTGLSGQLAAAIASAKDTGATAEQLTALTDLNTAISGSTSTLAKAVTANTPAVV